MKALVRRPGPRLAEGIVTHVERKPVDLTLALAQWDAYADVLRSVGWETLEVPPADESPDSVFVEDAVVVYGDVAVITRPGAEARRAEGKGVESAIAPHGYRIERISEPATLDGGDVLEVRDTLHVGIGGRTNGEGASQLRAILAPLGATVVEVPVEGVLHLKTARTALPDGSFVAGNVLPLGGDRVLVAEGDARLAEEVGSRGYEVATVDISEFQKLEGGVTCLSVRLRRTI